MQMALRVAVLVLALSACSERPPRTDPESAQAYTNETPQHPLYERTREQGRQ